MADLTLYSVSNEFEYICDLIDKEVLTPEEEEQLTNTLVEKIKNSGQEILEFIKSNDSQIDSIKAEIDSLTARKKRAENRKEVIKERLTDNMKKLHLDKIPTPIGTMLIPNKVDLSVEVVDIDKVPDTYKKTETKTTVDKTAVKNHFKSTGEIIDGINIIENSAKVQFRF